MVSSVLDISETATGGPGNSPEERAAKEDHSHRQSPPHSRSESAHQNRDEEPKDEDAQYPKPYLGGSSEGLLAQGTPESGLVLNRIRKNYVSLPTFNILQPSVALSIVVHSDAQKNITEPSPARWLVKNRHYAHRQNVLWPGFVSYLDEHRGWR
jgi:hypothetical protein